MDRLQTIRHRPAAGAIGILIAGSSSSAVADWVVRESYCDPLDRYVQTSEREYAPRIRRYDASHILNGDAPHRR